MNGSSRRFLDKRTRIIIGVIIALVLCIGGGIFIHRELFSETVDEEAYVSSVSTLMGNQRNGMRNRYQGVVESNKTWSLKVEGERPIKEYKVKVGDKIKKGAEILEYDNSETENAIENSKLELQRLQDELAEMNSEVGEMSRELSEATDELDAAQKRIDIQQKQLDIRNKTYDIESKRQEVANQEASLQSASVYCDISGVVKSLGNDGESDSVLVVNTGSFRIKAKVNEQNLSSLYKKEPVIVYSRADDELHWKGTISLIDKDHSVKNDEEDYDESGDEMTKSSDYYFYITLKEKGGLTVGQHVYVEEDVGQLDDSAEEFIELDRHLIVDADTDSPYVWADDGHGHLEKRTVVLGDYNKKAKKFRIEEGLTTTDLLAQPDDSLKAGVRTVNMDTQSDEDEEGDGEEKKKNKKDDGGEDSGSEDELGEPVFN